MTATADSRAEAVPDRLPGLRPVPLLILYVAAALVPLALAAAQGPPARNVWRELSSGLVMVGFSIMLVQFVLSGRFQHVSGQVGIDRTMRFHQLMAWAVLAFILVHPLLYAVPRLAEGPGAALASLNRMFGSPGLRTGVIAWWLIVLLVPLAVWRDRLPVRYEIWRLSHGLGAAAIAALSAHHTLSVGTYAGGVWLAGFWVALTGLALLSVAYVYVIKPALQRKAPYRVVSNRAVAHRMWEVAIEPEAGPAIAFAPGQFAWLNLGHSPFSVTEHPFSISSAPSQRPRIAFTIKESGDFTNRIGEIAAGTRAYVDGPHGNFTLAGRRAERIVFVAGGVGFAPIIGMLRQLRDDADRRPVAIVYGNRVEEQILYREEIDAMRDSLDVEIHLVLSEPPEGWAGKVGELTPDVLRGCLPPDAPGTLYFVCGPAPMMDSVEDTLAGFGVPARRIVSERFKYE
jgi:predicted ferric reductase